MRMISAMLAGWRRARERRRLLRAGQEAAARMDNAGAITHFRAAWSLGGRPQHARQAAAGLVKALLASGQLAEARTVRAEAIAAGVAATDLPHVPKDEVAPSGRGAFGRHQAVRSSSGVPGSGVPGPVVSGGVSLIGRRMDYDAVIVMAEAAAARGDVDAVLGLCDLYATRDIEKLEPVVVSKAADLWVILAKLYVSLGLKRKAIEAFSRAISVYRSYCDSVDDDDIVGDARDFMKLLYMAVGFFVKWRWVCLDFCRDGKEWDRALRFCDDWDYFLHRQSRLWVRLRELLGEEKYLSLRKRSIDVDENFGYRLMFYQYTGAHDRVIADANSFLRKYKNVMPYAVLCRHISRVGIREYFEGVSKRLCDGAVLNDIFCEDLSFCGDDTVIARVYGYEAIIYYAMTAVSVSVHLYHSMARTGMVDDAIHGLSSIIDGSFVFIDTNIMELSREFYAFRNVVGDNHFEVKVMFNHVYHNVLALAYGVRATAYFIGNNPGAGANDCAISLMLSDKNQEEKSHNLSLALTAWWPVASPLEAAQLARHAAFMLDIGQIDRLILPPSPSCPLTATRSARCLEFYLPTVAAGWLHAHNRGRGRLRLVFEAETSGPPPRIEARIPGLGWVAFPPPRRRDPYWTAGLDLPPGIAPVVEAVRITPQQQDSLVGQLRSIAEEAWRRGAWDEAAQAMAELARAGVALARQERSYSGQRFWLDHPLFAGAAADAAYALLRAHHQAAAGDIRGLLEESQAVHITLGLDLGQVDLSLLESREPELAADYRAAVDALLADRPAHMPPAHVPDDEALAHRVVVHQRLAQVRRKIAETCPAALPDAGAEQTAARHALVFGNTMRQEELAGTRLVYLVAGRQGGVAVICDGEAASARLLPGLTAAAATEAAHMLERANRQGEAQLCATLPRLCRWMWDAVMADLASDMQTETVLVPCGILGTLPWHAAAREENDGRLRYLIEDITVRYAPNAAFAARATTVAQGWAGRPLTARTVRDRCFARAFAQVDEAMGDVLAVRQINPTTDAVVEPGHLRHPIQDFACHGEIDPLQPMNSHLILATPGVRGEDAAADQRRLSVERLLSRSRSAGVGQGRLTVAAACSAGSRGQMAADHGLTVSSALMLQSAAVISPLFDVLDTTTADVLAGFYRQWLTRMPDDPAGALRAAQVGFLEQARAGAGAVRPLAAVAMMRATGGEAGGGQPDHVGWGRTGRDHAGRDHTGRDLANPFYWAGLAVSGA